jgi:hypothetical protein
MQHEQHLEQVSLKIDPALRAELARVAAAEHRSLSAQIRFLVTRALENGTAARAQSQA